MECVFDCAGGCAGESAARSEGVVGEVEAFEVVDVGVRQRSVPAGDAFSCEQVQDGGFGDAVAGGDFERGCAVAVGVNEFVDGVAGSRRWMFRAGVGRTGVADFRCRRLGSALSD